MNFAIGAIGANFAFGLISGISGAINSVYSLVSAIKQRTASGEEEIKNAIQKTDLENKIKTTQFLLCEIEVSEDTPNTILYCVQAINDSIKEIVDEMDNIYYRMQYNNNLWIGSSIRSYKFHNSIIRLNSKLEKLEERKRELINIIAIREKLYKNEKITDQLATFNGSPENLPNQSFNPSLLKSSQRDPSAAALIRGELHKKLEYVNKNL